MKIEREKKLESYEEMRKNGMKRRQKRQAEQHGIDRHFFQASNVCRMAYFYKCLVRNYESFDLMMKIIPAARANFIEVQ